MHYHIYVFCSFLCSVCYLHSLDPRVSDDVSLLPKVAIYIRITGLSHFPPWISILAWKTSWTLVSSCPLFQYLPQIFVIPRMSWLPRLDFSHLSSLLCPLLPKLPPWPILFCLELLASSYLQLGHRKLLLWSMLLEQVLRWWHKHCISLLQIQCLCIQCISICYYWSPSVLVLIFDGKVQKQREEEDGGKGRRRRDRKKEKGKEERGGKG